MMTRSEREGVKINYEFIKYEDFGNTLFFRLWIEVESVRNN